MHFDWGAIATVMVAAVGGAATWGAWVSVSIFKANQEIALLKQQVQLLMEVKDVLITIREQLGHRESIGAS